MTERRTKIEQLLIAEFSRDGYECFEFKDQTFARLTLDGSEVAMSDVCLTRLAGENDHGLTSRGIHLSVPGDQP